MNSQTVQILIAMVIYMAIVVVIGVVFAKKQIKAQKTIFLVDVLSVPG